MKIIGLTGPSGSGKSSVAKIAEKLNFAVIDCDKVAKYTVENNINLKQALAKSFGDDILDENQVLDRKKLAARAFSTPQNTKILNETTLPFIVNNVIENINTHKSIGKDKILLDAPTLFESGLDSICNAVIAVLSNTEHRKQRIIERDNLSEQQANDRLNATKQDSFYIDKTEHIIYNNAAFDEFLINAEKLLVLLDGM